MKRISSALCIFVIVLVHQWTIPVAHAQSSAQKDGAQGRNVAPRPIPGKSTAVPPKAPPAIGSNAEVKKAGTSAGPASRNTPQARTPAAPPEEAKVIAVTRSALPPQLASKAPDPQSTPAEKSDASEFEIKQGFHVLSPAEAKSLMQKLEKRKLASDEKK